MGLGRDGVDRDRQQLDRIEHLDLDALARGTSRARGPTGRPGSGPGRRPSRAAAARRADRASSRTKASGSAPATSSQRAPGLSASSAAICSAPAVSTKRWRAARRGSPLLADEQRSHPARLRSQLTQPAPRRQRAAGARARRRLGSGPTTSSMSSLRTAPVDITRPSATAGRGCRPPVDGAVDQHLLGAVGEHRVGRPRAPRRPRSGPATSTVPEPCSRAISTSPQRRPRTRALEQLVGMPLARSRPSVVATRLPAGKLHARLLDPEVDHVVLLAVAPDGGHPDAAALLLELRAAAPLRATVLPVFLASPTSASRRGRRGQLGEHGPGQRGRGRPARPARAR